MPVNPTRGLVYLRSHLWGRFSKAPWKSFGQPLEPQDPNFTFEEWADLPHRGGPFPVILAQSQLHVEQGHSRDDKEQCVRDQEGTWRTQRQTVTP